MESHEDTPIETGQSPQIKNVLEPNFVPKAEVPPLEDPHADIVRQAVSGDFDEEEARSHLQDVGGADRFKQITNESGNLPPTGSAEWSFGYSLNPQENSNRASSERDKPRGALDALKRLLGIADKEVKPSTTRETIDDSTGRSQAGLEEFQNGMIEKMRSSSADSDAGAPSEPQKPSQE